MRASSILRIVLSSIFIVACGLGLESKVLLAVVLVFFAVFFNAFQGTRDVDRNLSANARILGASRWRLLTARSWHADITMWITPKKAA